MVSKTCVMLLCATIAVCLMISNVSCQTSEGTATKPTMKQATTHGAMTGETTATTTKKMQTTTKKNGAGQLAVCLPLVLVTGLLAIKNPL